MVGGVYGGLGLVRRLQLRPDIIDGLNITLIDKKEYYENVLAYVQNFHAKMVKKYSDYMDKSEFICGEVRNINHAPNEVTIQSQEGKSIALEYDYLVVGLGTSYPFFKPEYATMDERSNEVNTFVERVQKSVHIMVVGGRGIGVELAGELAENFPNKRITLVHSRASLMDIWPQSGINLVHEFMNKFKVNLAKGYYSLRETCTISLTAPLLKIKTTGGSPNTAALAPHLSSALTKDKLIKINKFQQLQGYQNIFAMGDLCDVSENKNAILLKFQVPVVEHNIMALLNNEPLTQFDKGGYSLAYPSPWGRIWSPIEPATEQGIRSREIGEHITQKYYQIVNMNASDFDQRK